GRDRSRGRLGAVRARALAGPALRAGQPRRAAAEDRGSDPDAGRRARRTAFVASRTTPSAPGLPDFDQLPVGQRGTSPPSVGWPRWDETHSPGVVTIGMLSPLLLMLLAAGASPAKTPAPTPRKPLQPYCTGEYANDFGALSKQTVDFNNRSDSQFT